MNTEKKYQLADYIQRHGNATSIALFDPVFKIFKTPSVEGIIGYRDESQCAVVFGDPICDPKDMPTLTHAFHDYCQEHNKSIIYSLTSQSFKDWALKEKLCHLSIEVGNEIILSPFDDPRLKTGHDPRLLRNKWNQAQRNHIIFKEYVGSDPALEKHMNEVAHAWGDNRNGPQLYFGYIDLFAHRTNKRWFYTEQNGEILTVLMLNRIDIHQGWVINLLLRKPQAPTYLSEVTLLGALDILRNEQCNFLSVGPMPGLQLGSMEGFGTFTQLLARNTYKIAKKIFKLEERQRFWKKFEPHKAPMFVLFSNPRVKLRELKGIMKAFNANF